MVSVIYHSPSRPLFYLHLDCQLFCKGAGSQGERREAGVCVCVCVSSSGWFLAQGSILLDLLLFDAD